VKDKHDPFQPRQAIDLQAPARSAGWPGRRSRPGL